MPHWHPCESTRNPRIADEEHCLSVISPNFCIFSACCFSCLTCTVGAVISSHDFCPWCLSSLSLSSSPLASRSSQRGRTRLNGQATRIFEMFLRSLNRGPWSHDGLSWPLDHDLELSVVLRQRDSLLVAPMVSAARVEVVDSGGGERRRRRWRYRRRWWWQPRETVLCETVELTTTRVQTDRKRGRRAKDDDTPEVEW